MHLLKPTRLPWRASVLCGRALLTLLLLQPHLLVIRLLATSNVSVASMSALPARSSGGTHLQSELACSYTGCTSIVLKRMPRVDVGQGRLVW